MFLRGAGVVLGCIAGVVASGCGSESPQRPVEVSTGLALDGEAIRVVYGDGPGTAVEGNDPRLNAIHNGTEPQDASFAVTGTGTVTGRLTAGTEVVLEAKAPTASLTPLLRVRNTTGGDTEPAWDGFSLFTVDSAGGLLARGEMGFGTIPFSGKGYRMMWYPHKASFRAGYAETQWDDANIGFFSWAGGNLTVASAYGAFAHGDQCEATGTVAVCLGSANKASGTASIATGASTTASGFGSVSMGYTNVASGQGAVALGYRTTANADYSTALGYRVSSGGFTGSFIWGDQSTTSTTSATNSASNQFMVRAAGGVRLRTQSNLGTGCDLPAGSGAFACTSDRDTKEDFRRVNAEEVLAKVAGMTVESWRYKTEAAGVRHVGPVAQDFRAAFGLGLDDKSIGMLDIDGVNMVAIQALERRTQELNAKSAEVDALKSQVTDLQRSVERLEAAMNALSAKAER
ncbi:Head domain of trimeric autotransporter adhesin [Stigmatella aurantiaca]|uniref:Head domain of trimeric autotransporter adhesin n=1 Tax=Stigmatella aurantiaca TaxID=41 RepID=A0A1H7SSL9_STIAU|nr:tail fiber domain-containing protein [Stigmatella aurantiaca]SEL75561.1 Head domain of trimeric autotransporter adhesin [Stigmatella aurantiaca]